MFSFIKVMLVSILIASLSLINLTADAGQGQGQGGGGKGHGKSGIHGQGKAVGHGRGKKVTHGKGVKDVKKGRFTKFSAKDKKAIINYYNKNPIGSTRLPPGIAMNLARGKPLPPGIGKRDLSPELLSTLPTYPGHNYYLVGNDAVLVNSATGIVSDILSNVLH